MKKNETLRTLQKQKSIIPFSIIHKVLPLVIILLSFFIATQKTAREINYDASIIGKPFIIIHNQPVYHFYSIVFAWLSSARHGNDNIVYENAKLIVYGTILAVIIYVFLVYIRNTKNNLNKNLYYNGKWGDKETLKRNGLNKADGIVLGQTYDAITEGTMEGGGLKLTVKKPGTVIRFNNNVCILVLAGTRLGKGISIILPSHFDWKESIISVDPKGENYDISAGYRWLFSQIYKYCPTDYNTLNFNVMDEIDERFPVRDAGIIATILTQPKNPNANADPHWQTTAKILLTAAILHCKCSSYDDKSLPGVYKFLTKGGNEKDKTDAKKQLLKEMINGTHCTAAIHQSIKSYATQIMDAADEELGSIFSSTLEALEVFNDNILAASCSSSDFCLDDFKFSETPISLYLTIPFSDLDRVAPLIRLLIEFICRKFSQDLVTQEKQGLKHKIMFICDEMATLGTMESVEKFAGILNGYGISFLWVFQSKAQIDKLYGQNAPLLEHARYTVIYSITDDNIAEYFSKRIGTEGIIKNNSSTSGSKYDFGLNNVSYSSDIGERRLITAGEIETLPCDTSILIIQGDNSVLMKKIAYFSDERYMHKKNLIKPETRAELLLETETSRVIRDGDHKWWEDFEISDEDELAFYPEMDINEMQEESDVTEVKGESNPIV